VLPACDREDPTTIGAPLVENGAVRTFEIILDPSQYLVRDTAFSSFAAQPTDIMLLANTFEGVLSSNVLARYRVDPIIAITDTAGVIKVDSTPKLLRGRIIMKFDTVGSSRAGPVLLRLYRAAELWDTTATWRSRLPNVLWTTPGGTRGALIDTATYATGDSVVFRVDTLTLKQWRDSSATSPGVIVTVETPNTRLRATRPGLRVDYDPSFADTTVVVTTQPFSAKFISDPVVPPVSSDPRVGGSPSSFRSVIELRPDIANLVIPCPFTPTCRVRLKDASIAGAALLLQPVPTQPGFTPELPVTVLAYTLLPTPQLPLIRSPLGAGAGFQTFAPSSFRADQPETPLEITGFVRDFVAPIDTTTFNSRYLALLQGGTVTFGYASFRGQPRLRLRLSVAQEIQLP
jgi:hypothetical protein